jgi:hypothetical protein
VRVCKELRNWKGQRDRRKIRRGRETGERLEGAERQEKNWKGQRDRRKIGRDRETGETLEGMLDSRKTIQTCFVSNIHVTE